jgi:hypothetical protein
MQRAPLPWTAPTSPRWLFTSTSETWEVRRAVKNLVNNHILDQVETDEPTADELLPYLEAATKIRDAAEQTLAEVAKYAFSHGIEWKRIGKTLNVVDTAVQNRYGGKRGLTALTLAQLEDEAVAVSVFSDNASKDPTLEADDVEPREYLLYGTTLIGNAAGDFYEGMALIQDGDRAAGSKKIASSFRHLRRATEVLINRSTLDAVTQAATQIPPGAIEAYSPVSYTLQGIFQALLAFICLVELNKDEEEDRPAIDRSMLVKRIRFYLAESLATFVKPGPALIIHLAAQADADGAEDGTTSATQAPAD